MTNVVKVPYAIKQEDGSTKDFYGVYYFFDGEVVKINKSFIKENSDFIMSLIKRSATEITREEFYEMKED